MEGGNNALLFANDGSFMERFKQLQEHAAAAAAASSSSMEVGSCLVPSGLKPSPQQQKSTPPSGKLAFTLKQKTKSIVNPLKLDEDDEDGNDVQLPAGPSMMSTNGGSVLAQAPGDTIPPLPINQEVKKVAEKLAHFVARNGRQFEDLTRRKNPGDTQFRFLFDVSCSDYKYYSYCLSEAEKALGLESNTSGGASQSHLPKKEFYPLSHYQTPASALYSGIEAQLSHQPEARQATVTKIDSVSMMEFYTQKAAADAMRKPHKRSREEAPPSTSLQTLSAPGTKRGHHMGDYIPQEVLEKFLAKCSDGKAQSLAEEAAERARIQSDNVGHRLLSKMGWKEGEGLGSGRDGRANPVEAGSVKTNNLGVGAVQPGEVTFEDDIYEQYKKRMMLGYRHRPNPLNNPRKAYY